MELRLDDKVALVTGASRGIGLATAEKFALAGAKVMMASRKQDALDNAVGELASEAQGNVETCAAHVGEPDDVAAVVKATVERLGGLDILVNNAATNPYMGPTIEVDLPRFDKIWDVNFRGQLVCAQRAHEAWMKDHGGSIINVSSIGAIIVEPAIGVYNSTKAALISLTRTLAAELAPGVRVNAIAPGLVKTHLARALWEPAEEVVASMVPLKRLGTPDDIANMALFLSSEAASWITGQTMIVDGGITLGMQR